MVWMPESGVGSPRLRRRAREALWPAVYITISWVEMTVGAVLMLFVPSTGIFAWVPFAVLAIAAIHLVYNTINDPLNLSDSNE